ncbi:MAG: DUF6056 family protein [Porticoccaceae bacterium]
MTNNQNQLCVRRSGIDIRWSAGWETVCVVLLMGSAFLLLYKLHLSIYPYSHEWEYGSLLRSMGLIDFSRHHYFEMNGRLPVHLMIGLLSTGDIELWRWLNPALMVGYSALLYRLINRNDHANAPLAAALIALLLVIDQSSAQSGLFWLTGALNYAWPTMLAVVVFSLLFRHYTEPKSIPYAGYFLPLLGFLAGWSTEQGGAIALGMSGATIAWFGLLKGKHIPSYHWVTLAVMVIGYGLLILSPGNDVRIGGHDNFYSQAFVGRTAHRITEVSHQLISAKAFALLNVFHLVLLTACSWRLRNSGRGYLLLNRAAPILFVALLLLQGVIIIGPASLAALTNHALPTIDSPFSAVFFGLYLTAALYVAYLAFADDYGMLFPLFFLAAIGSQLLFIFAPPDSGRIFVPGVMLFIASAACLYYQLFRTSSATRPAARYTAAIVICLILLGLGLNNYLTIAAGYDSNRSTLVTNQHTINSYLSSNSSAKQIVLSRLPSPAYHWEMPYQNPYFIPFYYRYYDIPRDTKLIWTGTTTDTGQRTIIDLTPELEETLKTSATQLLTSSGCTAYYWQHYIIFAVGNWACSAIWQFNLTSTPIDGSTAFYKNQRLYYDQYMVVVQNLEGHYQSYQSYHLPYDATNTDRVYLKWGNMEATITLPKL